MVVQIAAGLLALIVALLVIVRLIRYRITSRWLLITILGVPVRWVSLRNIRYLTDHSREPWYEPWPNTHGAKTRALFVRKRRGLFRTLFITPQKRFVFKAELEKAIRALDPKADFRETQFYTRDPQTTGLRHHTAGS